MTCEKTNDQAFAAAEWDSAASPRDMMSLACEFGECRQDRYILGRDHLDALIAELAALSSLAKRVRERGGVVVVEKDGAQLTTYNADSYRWSRS